MQWHKFVSCVIAPATFRKSPLTTPRKDSSCAPVRLLDKVGTFAARLGPDLLHSSLTQVDVVLFSEVTVTGPTIQVSHSIPKLHTPRPVQKSCLMSVETQIVQQKPVRSRMITILINFT